ncbi:MAG: phage head morphogenesis protein [Treponema sp.]|nr:phage head morphogenesis protein [Treponema sp.]
MIDPLTGKTVNAQLGSDRRLRTIYDTNIRSAYQEGRWERAQESTAHPYLMYRVGPSKSHRKEHLAWDGLVLPKDDPWWDSHYPPNGWGCKCWTMAVSEGRKQKLKETGISVPPSVDGEPGYTVKVKTQAPKITYKYFVNERKGTVEPVPIGIDPAFNWNVGKAGRDVEALERKIEEARSMLQSEPVALEKIQNIAGIKDVSLPKIPENVQEGILDGFKAVLGRYPNMQGQFLQLNDLETRKNVFASCVIDNGAISVNRKFFKNISTLATEYNEEVNTKWFPEGTDWKAIIVHEIGHRVNGILKWQYWTALKGVPVEKYIKEKALANLGLNDIDIRRELSGNAGLNSQEFLAEAFSEFFNSKAPRRLAKEVIRLVDLAMKGKLL